MSPKFSRIASLRILTSNNWPLIMRRWRRVKGESGSPVRSKTSNRTSEGSNMVGNSSTVRVHTNDAIMLPLDAPEIIRGNNWFSYKHLTTPIWFNPKVPPPLSNNAVLPKLCLIFIKKSCLAFKSKPGSFSGSEGSSHIQFNCSTTSSI